LILVTDQFFNLTDANKLFNFIFSMLNGVVV
jgi:hypothetical protein